MGVFHNSFTLLFMQFPGYLQTGDMRIMTLSYKKISI